MNFQTPTSLRHCEIANFQGLPISIIGANMTTNQIPAPSPISLSPMEVAHVTGLSKTTIYNFMSEGLLPFMKFGRQRLIMIRDLETLLAKARQRAPSTD